MIRHKKLGQCFLNSSAILYKEASIAAVKGKIVLEIGAGDGRLTQELLDQGAAKIIAVEKDREYAEMLRKRFVQEPRIEIAEGDFLKLEFPKVDVVIGNIPYYISSPILFKLPEMKWMHAVLMLQKEFAEKMLAKPNEKNYGRLSVTAQLNFSIQYIQTVPKRFFSPRPKVDSAIVLLKPMGKKPTQHQQNIIRILFQHKNQTVKNALKHGKISVTGLEKWLKRRVRTLSPEECLEIAAIV